MRPRLTLAAAIAVSAPGLAAADDDTAAATATVTPEEVLTADAPGRDDVADRELSGSLGLGVGGGLTAGGLRLTVDYLYQLSDIDWFDGGITLSWGPTGAECFRDRADDLICDHGAADGAAVDVRAGVRRFAAAQQGFRPWARPSVLVRVVSFSADDITGVGVVAQGAAGVRARVTDRIAVGGAAALEAGGAWFSRGRGPALQLGLSIGVTVDFSLPDSF